MESMIRVENVAHAFGEENVLKDINLSIPKGEIFGLLGPSGAGKTTLVKVMVGILEVDQGEAWVKSVKMPSLEQMKVLGYMAQSDALYSELSARENLDFFGAVYELKSEERKERMKAVMDVVGLRNHMDKPVHKYSGGMKRRLSLAIALLHEPDVLILDEPTVGIDPLLRQSIWDELKSLQEKGTTIIVTTHVMDEAEKCDRLAMMRDGYLIATGTPQQLRDQTNSETIEGAFLVYGGERA
ncbi:ATP-binding cassette domain-containing protein [Pontibacillus yanchengensis]|uniref:ATP-binding cassette domain-containing protein n=2 Tax=Pontibacillus yanchengensis TaxID=462910 RepID=A0ACC7VKT8_9BACI|nr:ABC transporter ATP-binding protein [Pontibacillus yanchengensis]MYL34880.1 ATP-binding cassette domain-containing protein [Pontibacillus yanchengensis]MYL54745.1 ATP-binding cassette domain-containing protein [Pontibacillus yanchengensis]